MQVVDIIKKAGGPSAIAARAAKLTADAVYKWKAIGIPDQHWPLIIELCAGNGEKVTAQHLYEANVVARAAAKARAAA